MAVRSGMSNLIRRLRVMVADRGSTQYYDDDQIQDFLDRHRVDVWNEYLTPMPSFTSAGVGPQYLSHQAEAGDWEEDAIIQSNVHATVTPDTPDYQTGKFTFTTQPSYPLFITGRRYDLYGAAVDALEQRAAEVAGDFDFSTGGQTFNRSQAVKGMLELAARYRTSMWPTSVPFVRSDIGSNFAADDYEATLRR